MGRLAGKTALVTGASSGIGAATAMMMASEGARVVVADVDDAAGEAICATAGRDGATTKFCHLDVREEEQWVDALQDVERSLGGLDILVNVAAVCSLQPIGDMSHATWRWHLDVDLDGKFFGCKHALPMLARSGSGAIINLSSSTVIQGTVGGTAYGAAKGGVLAFSRALAVECGRAGNGVRVNCIIPGPIETPIWTKMFNDGSLPASDEDRERLDDLVSKVGSTVASGNLVGRVGRPEDIAAGIVYLASDEASYVTGAELVIDGGSTIV